MRNIKLKTKIYIPSKHSIFQCISKTYFQFKGRTEDVSATRASTIRSAWQIGRGKCESARLKIGILGSLGQIIWIMATNEMTNHELAQMGWSRNISEKGGRGIGMGSRPINQRQRQIMELL